MAVLHTAPPERMSASAAIAFARSHGLNGHVFNDHDFGGPLIFNDATTHMYRIVMEWFAAAGFTPRPAHRAFDWGACLALVGAGLGVLMLHAGDTAYRVRRLVGELARRIAGAEDHRGAARVDPPEQEVERDNKINYFC